MVKAETQFSGQLYFLVVALRQALRGRDLMEHFGYEMPAFRQADLIQSWRNVEEHWDDPAKGQPIRALAAWWLESDEVEPGLSHSGADKLTEASGLRMKWVRKDLRALRDAVGNVSEREWERCYLTPDRAAAILGITPEELANLEHHLTGLDPADASRLRRQAGREVLARGSGGAEGGLAHPATMDRRTMPGLSPDPDARTCRGEVKARRRDLLR